MLYIDANILTDANLQYTDANMLCSDANTLCNDANLQYTDANTLCNNANLQYSDANPLCPDANLLSPDANLLCTGVLSGFETPTSMFTLVVLIVTIVVCLSHVCFGHFKYLSAHNYKVQQLLPTRVRNMNVGGRSAVSHRVSVSDRHQGERCGRRGEWSPGSSLVLPHRQVSGESGSNGRWMTVETQCDAE